MNVYFDSVKTSENRVVSVGFYNVYYDISVFKNMKIASTCALSLLVVNLDLKLKLNLIVMKETLEITTHTSVQAIG